MSYYAKVSKTLKKYKLNWNTFKYEPHKLFLLDKNFIKYWMHTFKYDQDITWWSNPYNLSLHVSEKDISNIVNEYENEDFEFVKDLLDWIKDTCK